MKFAAATSSRESTYPHSVGSGLWPSVYLNPNRIFDNDFQTPFLPPPVFSGGKFVMYLFFKSKELDTMKQVSLSARTPQGHLQISIPVTKITTIGRSVHLLATRGFKSRNLTFALAKIFKT